MQRTIRSFVLALVLLVLAAGTVQARPLAVQHPAPAGFLESLWQWVASYLPHTLKEGGTMDPDGVLHNSLPPLPTTDAGGDMDPDG